MNRDGRPDRRAAPALHLLRQGRSAGPLRALASPERLFERRDRLELALELPQEMRFGSRNRAP